MVVEIKSPLSRREVSKLKAAPTRRAKVREATNKGRPLRPVPLMNDQRSLHHETGRGTLKKNVKAKNGRPAGFGVKIIPEARTQHANKAPQVRSSPSSSWSSSSNKGTDSERGAPNSGSQSSDPESESSDSDDDEDEGKRSDSKWKDRFKQAMAFNKQLSETNKKLQNEMTFVVPSSSTPFALNNQNQQLVTLLNDTLSNRQTSISASALGPCVAQEGGDIQITDWECWKRQFEAWLKASNVTEPETQQTYFDIYAGSKLAIALATAPEISNSDRLGYNLTVSKLDAVFKSRCNSFSLKKDFRSMMQHKGENNVTYLSRLMRSALRIWDRTDPLIDDEIMLTMTVNTNSSKMQEFALRISADGPSGQNSYEELVNQARLVDSLSELKGVSEARVLALSDKPSYVPRPVYANGGDRNSERPQGNNRFKSNNQNNQFLSNRSNGPKPRFHNEPDLKCYCCGVMGHRAASCSRINESCRYCGGKGHIREACFKRLRGLERRDQESGESSAKRARVEDVKNVELTNQANPGESSKVITEY